MKRVFCIEDSNEGQGGTHVFRGRIYTVIDKRNRVNTTQLYYKLLEMDPEWWYRANLFVDLTEDQQDETTFVRDYNKETV